MTGHEALDVAQIIQFEFVAFAVLIFKVVIEAANHLVTNHQCCHFLEIVAIERVVKHHLLRQLDSLLFSS